MNRGEATGPIVGVVVLVLALVMVVAVALGAFGTARITTSYSTGGPLSYPPDDGSFGVVFDLQASEGWSLFKVSFGKAKYAAYIGLVPPSQCLTSGPGGGEELLSDGVCAELPAHGEVAGSGTTVTGSRLVILKVAVSKACFETLSPGDRWPAADC